MFTVGAINVQYLIVSYLYGCLGFRTKIFICIHSSGRTACQQEFVFRRMDIPGQVFRNGAVMHVQIDAFTGQYSAECAREYGDLLKKLPHQTYFNTNMRFNIIYSIIILYNTIKITAHCKKTKQNKKTVITSGSPKNPYDIVALE